MKNPFKPAAIVLLAATLSVTAAPDGYIRLQQRNSTNDGYDPVNIASPGVNAVWVWREDGTVGYETFEDLGAALPIPGEITRDTEWDTASEINGNIAPEAFVILDGNAGTPSDIDLTNAINVPATNISGVIPVANLATGTPTGSKFIRDDGVLAVPAGGGDVTGPGSSTDNGVPRFDGTTGDLLQGSPVTIADTGTVSGLIFAPNQLKLTDASGDEMTVALGSTLTDDRTFTLTTGDAARTLDISAGNVVISAAGIAILDDTDAEAMRATLGLTIGTNVQAYSALLGSISGLSYSGNANKAIRVNGAGNAFELALPGDAFVADPLSQFAATTSAQLAGVLTDEGGEGGVFLLSEEPMITSPAMFGNIDMSGANHIGLPGNNAPTTASVARMAFDYDVFTTRGAVQVHDGLSNTYLIGAQASDTPGTAQVPQYSGSGTVTWETVGGGSWVLGREYTEGLMVAHNDAIYLCTDGHTAATINQPGVGGDWTDYWDPNAIPFSPAINADNITSGTVDEARIDADVTRDTEWDTAAEINAATTDDDFLTLTGTQSASGKTFLNLAVANGATSAGILTLFEDSDDGTNFASLRVPALAANTVYVLPPDDGDAGEQLTTDGDGNLTWESAGAGSGIADGATLGTGLTFPVAGLHILDTNASHDLILSPGSDLTADRTLTVITGDSDRSLTMTGNASISGTNTGDQTTVTGNAGTVTFADAAGDTTTHVALGTDATGSLAPATDAELTYNATTNALTAGSFVGALVGNASTATTATTVSDEAITVAKIADGTPGELITWDATGEAATVSAGTAGHVLTSNGAGAAPTFQAPSGGGGDSLAVYYKPTDEGRASDTTYADDDDMVATLEANSIYEFELFLSFSGETNGDMKFRVTRTGLGDAELRYSGDLDSASAATFTWDTASVCIIPLDTPNRYQGTYIGTVVTGSNTGDIAVQWAQNISDVVPTVLHTGSRMKLRKLN